MDLIGKLNQLIGKAASLHEPVHKGRDQVSLIPVFLLCQGRKRLRYRAVDIYLVGYLLQAFEQILRRDGF